MYIGLFDADKNERRELLGSVEEIYHHADELRERCAATYREGDPKEAVLVPT